MFWYFPIYNFGEPQAFSRLLGSVEVLPIMEPVTFGPITHWI
jgi:hypothetical protein